MNDDFLRRLHELDATYAGRSVPGGLEARALERLREAQGRRRALPWIRPALALGFVAGAVAALLMTRTLGTSDAARVQPSIASVDPIEGPEVASALELAGVTMTSRPCSPTREGDVVALPAACRLSGDGVELSTIGPSRLSGGPERLRVLAGAVLFAVEPRDRAAPLAIAVSGGVIEVVGTRFLVHEDGARGDVELFEGRLRFIAADGAVRLIAPGERLAWSADEVRTDEATAVEPAAPPPEAAPPGEPRRRAPRRSAAEAQEISRRVTAHRHRGAHADAARELEAALRAGGWPRGTAEVWSYELGTLYADELDARASACAQWREHLRRFPRGTYAPAVAAALKRLDCGR